MHVVPILAIFLLAAVPPRPVEQPTPKNRCCTLKVADSTGKTIGDLEALVQQASSLAVRAPEAGRADVQRAPPSETITFPVWNRRGRARSSSCEFSGLDPASCARVHVDSGIRTRASADDRRPGDLCGQSSEPPGYTSHSDGVAATLALPCGTCNGERLLRRGLSSGAAHGGKCSRFVPLTISPHSSLRVSSGSARDRIGTRRRTARMPHHGSRALPAATCRVHPVLVHQR